MRKIHETEFNGGDCSASQLIIYELDEGEYFELFDKYEDNEYSFDNDRMLEDMGYFSEWGSIMPGAQFTRYYVLSLIPEFLVIEKEVAYNV